MDLLSGFMHGLSRHRSHYSRMQRKSIYFVPSTYYVFTAHLISEKNPFSRAVCKVRLYRAHSF